MRRPTNDADADETYCNAIDALWQTYEPKFRSLLGRLSDTFTAEGWTTSGIYDASDEEYETVLTLTSPDSVDCGVRVTLVESQCREGSLDGIAFSLDLDSQCGHVIGGMCPFNYSGDLWIPVDDADAIADRWSYFENADEYEAVAVLVEHLEGCTDARQKED